MADIRYSKQRALILDNLKSRHDHPSADEIYASLKVDHPNLSLGTVYRNLGFLVDTKQIRKLDVGEAIVHYDGDIHPHQHFICKKCGKIFDIDFDLEKVISDEMQKHSHFHIESFDLIMSGTCQECAEKEN